MEIASSGLHVARRFVSPWEKEPTIGWITSMGKSKVSVVGKNLRIMGVTFILIIISSLSKFFDQVFAVLATLRNERDHATLMALVSGMLLLLTLLKWRMHQF